MDPTLENFKTKALEYAVPVLYKIGGALLLWIFGRMAISAINRLIHNALERRKLDPTLIRYVDSMANVSLTILLLIALLGVFGVETTSFAAVLAAAGIAIGTAWSGLLANFAAGVFLVILRPFRVGDYISAGGVTGQVHEIGLFATTIDTDQNLRVFVGNNKIFGDNITNFSSNAYRRVDLVAQLAGSVDPQEAIRALRERIAKIPGVLQSPAPAIELVDFKLEGPVLAVRPFCKHPDYWSVYFATNVAIQETFSAAGYPAPSRQIHLVQKAG